MNELYYVTSNPDKFAEVDRFVRQAGVPLILKQAAIELVEIQSLDAAEIARDKARQAWEILKKPCIVDDAGIYFERYNNFPGTMTKFIYESIGFEGLFKLIEPGDRAYFKLVLAYCASEGSIVMFEGICHGTTTQPVDNNFPAQLPYAAVFIPDGQTRTLAELRLTDEDHPYNYRIFAFKQFLAHYHDPVSSDKVFTSMNAL